METLTANDIMSQPARTISGDATLSEAAEVMLNEGIGSLVVTEEDGRMVGILTDSDFGSSEARVPFSTFKAPTLMDRWIGKEGVEQIYEEARRRRVREIMSSPVHSVDPGVSLREILDLMLHREVKHVPVLREGKPAGMVARHDLLKAMKKRLSG